METFAQILGFIGLALAIVSFQSNRRRNILLFQLLAGTVFTLHFLLIGAYTGSLLNVIGVARSAVFSFKGKKWADSRVWIGVFCAAMAVIGIFTWDGPASLLPTVAMMLTTVAFFLSNPTYIRRLNLPSSPMWMVYNLINRSYGGILTECFVMTSLLIAMFRFDRKKKV
ncbi:MAG: YgjV family protein [Clostridia bacterium]|nr:YgjV family protein [Clostridia bacterium]